MKATFIIANWKANKTTSEATEWLQELKINDLRLTNKEVIVCPAFSVFSSLQAKMKEQEMPIRLGAQDISMFGTGAYTGEMPAALLKEFVTYALIGHSERRRYFHETEEMIGKKIEQALSHGITPIVCVSSREQVKNFNPPAGGSNFKLIIAYEPLSAIGTGRSDSPENAENMAKEIKETFENASVLYGGSVTADNVNSFTSQEHIDGVLVGGASLDAYEFSTIIKNA